MEIKDAVSKAIGLAVGSSLNSSNYDSVSACKKCIELSKARLFYRMGDIADYIVKKPNYLLPLADTYYIAYSELERNKYIFIIGGRDDIVNLVSACSRKLICVLNTMLSKKGNLGLDALPYLYNYANRIDNAVIVVFKWS